MRARRIETYDDRSEPRGRVEWREGHPCRSTLRGDHSVDVEGVVEKAGQPGLGGSRSETEAGAGDGCGKVQGRHGVMAVVKLHGGWDVWFWRKGEGCKR